MTVRDYLEMLAGIHERNGLPGGIISPARWLLDHGVEYTEHASVPKHLMGEPQRCFANAGRAALLDDIYTYVEGYVLVHGVPIEHAWLVDDYDLIYEVTISDRESVDGYFGAPIDRYTLRQTVLRTEMWGVLDPMFNPEMYHVVCSVCDVEGCEKRHERETVGAFIHGGNL